VWEVFRKYHYLNTELHQAAQQWVGVVNGEMVCHTGVIQFPMRRGWKRVHRLVVLPDYQGVGVGMKFINAIAKHYVGQGWKVNIGTTTPAMVGALRKSAFWILIRFGRSGGGHAYHNMALQKCHSKSRITFSFNYKAKQ
jgi:GNAT superfamily N-acetyltransferase